MKRSTLIGFVVLLAASDAVSHATGKAAANEPTGAKNACESQDAATSSEQPSQESAASKVADAVIRQAPAPLPPKPKLIHGVFRYTSYPSAWTVAQQTNRPILIYVTSQACPHCVKMVEKTYKRPQVHALLSNSFETVYVDRHQQPKLIAKLKVRWFPTTIVVAPNNKVIDKIEGYVDPAVFTQRIHTQLAAHQAATLKNAQNDALVQK